MIDYKNLVAGLAGLTPFNEEDQQVFDEAAAAITELHEEAADMTAKGFDWMQRAEAAEAKLAAAESALRGIHTLVEHVNTRRSQRSVKIRQLAEAYFAGETP